MPKKNEYNAESMEAAINEVKNNKTSYRNAAHKYGVPKSTLEFKIKNPGHKDTCGPNPILSAREESDLVRWIEELATKGFPRKREDILSSVQKFLTENPRPNPFKNNRPGDSWFKAFLKRHPTIVQRTSEAVSGASACVSEADIRKWFKDINSYLISKNLTIDDPSRIYNGDESGFQICPETGKVFAGKGAKNVYSVEKGSSKENITVMFSFSASGLTCPPMIVYPYKRVPEKISQTVKDPDWGIGRSDNGWMTAETFYDYIKNVFHRFLVKNNIQFPVLLFLDGHKSHLTYELSILCNELNIEVIALYPNATRILQPCDVAVFRPIKMGWKKAVREFYEQYPGEVLNKMTFAPLLEKVVANNVKRDTLINGFRACGLFPFNPDAVDYTKCLGNKNERPEVKMPPPRMDHKTFVSLTGEDLIKRFKSFDDLLIKEGITEEFLTLYKIWSYFEKPDSLPVNKKDDLDMIDVPGSFGNQVLNSTEAKPEIDPSENQPSSAPERKINLDAELNSSENQLSKEPKINITQNIVIKPGKDNIYRLPSTSKNMGDYLVVPEKPTRKNKRNIERVSFAITSREYQQSFEKKRALKLELENKKLERKRKREENAAAKALKKTARDTDKNNSCFVCNVRTIKNNYLTCNSCKKRIHRRCIPKKYNEHVPEEGDEDLFMCHMCYTEESDDDDDISEIESEEDGEMYNENELDRRMCKRFKEIESEEDIETNYQIESNLKIYEEPKEIASNEDNVDQEPKEIDNKKGNEIYAQKKNYSNLCDESKKVESSECYEVDEQDETNSPICENSPGKIESEEGIDTDDQMKTSSKICEEPKMGSNKDFEDYGTKVGQMSENNANDDLEVEELFSMYQNEMKKYK